MSEKSLYIELKENQIENKFYYPEKKFFDNTYQK